MISCYLANVDTASISSNLTRCVNSYRNMAEEITARCKYPSFKTIIFNLGKCMINTQNEVYVCYKYLSQGNYYVHALQRNHDCNSLHVASPYLRTHVGR